MGPSLRSIQRRKVFENTALPHSVFKISTACGIVFGTDGEKET